MRKDLEWEYADANVPAEEVKKVGLQFGFLLPEDYIECVKVNGGASVFPEEFKVGEIERCFGNLFSFDKESSEYIVKSYHLYKPALPRDVFPFAIDPAGNLICFDYKDHKENPIVVFWDHENAWEKEMLMHEERLTEEQAEERARDNVLYIADSFTEFLHSIYD